MKIVHFRGKHPNFGDELNLWLWPRVLPNFFDEDESTYFIGIGSTIGEKAQSSSKKIIFGAGYVETYNVKPDFSQKDWHVYFVRGPRTAKTLGLAPEMAISDSAILIRTVLPDHKLTSEVVSFIPHWQSVDRGNWQLACQYAGINFIDPRLPVEDIVRELLRSKVVIAEAMHGAIVSDALRVPWIPVVPLEDLHRAKWLDWADSLGMNLHPQTLWPSSVRETRMLAGQTKPFGPLIRSIRKKQNSPHVAEPEPDPARDSPFEIQPVARPGAANRFVAQLAAHRLQSLAKCAPTMSADSSMERVTDRMLGMVEQLKADYSR